MKINNRNLNIDAIKGMTIMLVVLGHCIQYVYSVDNFDKNIFFRVIYSFHMPLFMFISGYLSFRQNKEINAAWLKKRAGNLVVPFVVWFFISYLLQRQYSFSILIDKAKLLIKSPDSGLWFLWVLFLNCLVLFAIIYISKYIGDIIFPVVILFSIFLHTIGIPIDILGLYLFLWHVTFFLLGYLLSKYRSTWRKYDNKIVFGSLLLFPFFVIFWRRTTDATFIKYLVDFLTEHGLPLIFAKVINVAYYYLTPLLGIGFICSIIKLLKWKKWLAFFGCYTVEIYILHFYFISIIKTQSILFNTITSFCLGITLPIILAKIINNNNFTSKLLFGKN